MSISHTNNIGDVTSFYVKYTYYDLKKEVNSVKENKIRRMLVATITGLLTFSLIGCGKDDADTKAQSDEVTEVVYEEASSEPGVVSEIPEETSEEETEVVPEDTTSPIQNFWAGDWYGYMWIDSADGGLAEWANCYWDALATIDVDENGNADMLFWYESLSRENPAGHVQLTISEASGSGEMGAAISESGWIFVDSDTGNGDVKHADWIIDPMTDATSAKFGNDMIHFYGEYVEGDGSLSYHYFLRKWGTYWDDVATDEDELMPRGYEIWYKPLIDDGYAMPNNIGDAGSVKMDGSISDAAPITETTDNQSSTASAPSDAPVSGGYDGGELVLVDDEYCKITVTGTGCNANNDAWIGYVMEIINKTDNSLYFTSYAEPDLNGQTINDLGKGNTCFFGGSVTKTHMGYTLKGGKTMSDACLAIDGVTDTSQLNNVQGYISVSNNDTGEVLNNIPYSF